MAAILLLAFGLTPARGDTRFSPDRPWDLTHLRLDLKVDLQKRHVDAEAALDLKATRAAERIELDAVELAVASVRIQRGASEPAPTHYNLAEGKLEVHLDGAAARSGESLRVLVNYSVTDPRKGLHFFAPCEGDPDIPLQVWSQGQSNNTRRWIPCFDDPGEFQTTELLVTTAGGNEVLSNGRLVEKRDHPDGTVTFHWLQDKPHASYLITLVIGRFAVLRQEWRGRPVLFYVPPERQAEAMNAFGRTLQMMDLFSRKTGVEYPWDKYAQVCAEQFGGGMENTSATTLGTGVLHDDRAHLDTDVDDLIAHELAHQWFGDLVTCRTWSHVWLNEGFASLFEAVWAQEAGGKDACQEVIHRFREQSALGAGDAPMVDREYEDADDMFDARVYQKAGFMLHALKARMGEEAFWAAVHQYLTRYQHQAVETHDFRRVMETAYGSSLERFFYDWTERGDQPRIDLAYAWNPQDRTATITVRQKQEGPPFEFPLQVEMDDGEHGPRRHEYAVRDKVHTFTVPCASEPRRVSFDPEQLVPGEMKIELPRALWIEELHAGASLSGRIRAAHELAKAKSEENVAVLAAALDRGPFYALAEEIAGGLAKADLPAARAALLRGLESPDPRIRRTCAAQLGKVAGGEEVTDRLRRLIAAGDPSIHVEAAAIGALADRHPEDVVSILTPLLSRASDDEVIRRAVLRALADQKDAAALETLLEWTGRGKPGLCRRSAIQAVGRYLEKHEPDRKTEEDVVRQLSKFLDGESDRLLGGVISTLGAIGKPAAAALPRLEEIADSHPDEHVQRAARKAIDQIEAKPREAADKERKRGAQAREDQQDQENGNEAPAGDRKRKNRQAGHEEGDEPDRKQEANEPPHTSKTRNESLAGAARHRTITHAAAA